MNLETYPWQHIVTDSIINKSFLDKIIIFSKERIDNNKFGYAFWDESDIDYQIYRNGLQSKMGSLLKLLSARSHTDLVLVDHLTINPQGYSYPVHCEHPDKIISFVTYIYPEASIGTKLHTTEFDPPVKEIPWVPGNTMIFAGNDNITWHSYCSGDTTPRVTLCSFFINLKSIKEFEHWKRLVS